MKEKTVKVANRNGLHARPAAMLVKLASNFSSHIELVKEGVAANAKSILGVMILAAEFGSEITIHADGEDEDAAVEKIAELISTQFHGSENG